MKMTKSHVKRKKRKIDSIDGEIKYLERRVKSGTLANSERRYKANNLAKECLSLSRQCKRFTNCPNTSKYLSDLFLELALGLKEFSIGYKDDYKPHKNTNPYKNPVIHRKVIK